MNETNARIDSPSEEEQLDEFVADLLSKKKYREAIERLFSRAKGAWVPVKTMCAGFVETNGIAWPWLGELGEEELMAIWLDYPGSDESEGQALIVFFYPRSYWSKTAFYNRNTLPK